MSVCPTCAAPGQHEGARFCFSCGTSVLSPGCVSCGFELAPGSRFCPSCGTPQQAAGGPPAPGPSTPVASRRITSVLSGDLVGFTALSETRDQEDVRELLSGYSERCSQVIARYGGTTEPLELARSLFDQMGSRLHLADLHTRLGTVPVREVARTPTG